MTLLVVESLFLHYICFKFIEIAKSLSFVSKMNINYCNVLFLALLLWATVPLSGQNHRSKVQVYIQKRFY